MQRKRLVSDSTANASFAFAAVFMLIAVTASGTVISKCEDAAEKFAASSLEAESMSRIKSMVASEMELVIQGAVSRALTSLRRTVDVPRLEEEVGRTIREYIAARYPAAIGSRSIDVKALNISVSLSSRSDSRDPGSQSPGAVVVNVELEICAEGEGSEYRTNLDLSHELESPSLFLSSKLDGLDFSAGAEGNIGRIARSILSQLVQLRVLQGCASPDNRSGAALGNLLTAADVELAVNLALALQQLSDFGTLDPRSWDELRKRASVSILDLDADWFSEAVDPFKTYMLLRGQEMQGGVNLRDFVLQTLYSLVDQLVIRFLDYYHAIDLADCALGVGRSLDNGWHDFVEFMTGVDSRLEEILDEIARLFYSLDVPYCAWRELFGGDQDIAFNSNPSTVQIFDSKGTLVPVLLGGVQFSLDLPVMSILNSSAWKSFCNATAKEAISAGDAVERVVLGLCRGIADTMPSEQVYGSLSAPEQYVQSMLGAVEARLASIEEYALASTDTVPAATPQVDRLLDLRQFIAEHWSSIFPFDEAAAFGRSALAAKLADTAVISDPASMPLYWKQDVASIVAKELGGGLHSWEAELRSGINRTAEAMKDIILAYLDREISARSAGTATLSGSIAKWVEDGVPAELMLSSLRCQALLLALQIRNMSEEFQLCNAVGAIPVQGLKLLDEFATGKNVSDQPFTLMPELSQSPAYLQSAEMSPSPGISVDNVDCTGRLVVSIFRPDGAAQCRPKSSHYTGFDVLSSFPYETNWVVRAKGTVKLSAADGFNPSSQACREIHIDLIIPVTAISGWPLKGVQYETSNNLLGDALALLDKVKGCIWEHISPLIAAHQKALNILMDSLSDLSKYLNGFAEQVAKAFNEFGDFLVSTCLGILERIQNSPLWKFVELYLDICGNVETRFNYGPATIIVSCSLPDLLFRKAKDLVRIVVVMNLGKMNVSLGFRLAKLSSGTLDVVVNSTVQAKDLVIEMRLDPLMAVRDHLIEIRGSWHEYCLQLWSPEVNDYKQFSVKLSDIPILGSILSNIPIPELGISISIDAGLIVKYNLPICDAVVINEVELNPPNRDAGKEWVELYNPLAKEMSVEGWTLETMHGEISLITLSGTIPARGTRAFTFPRASLDNGNSGDTFAMGDSILLRGPDGGALDMTPLISDTANDGKTWHRSWDGAPKWVFGPATKGKSNGNALLHTYPDLLLKICVDSLYLAIQDEMDNVSASFDFVKNLITSFLRELIGQMAEFAASLVEEVSLFVEVGLNDLSGSGGGGFRLKVSADGEIFRQLVIWFAEQITKLLGRVLFHKELSTGLLKGCNPADAIYIGFDLFGRIGVPKWVKTVVSLTGSPTELRIALSFYASLATVAKLFGLNIGKFCLRFGLHVDDLPGASLISPLALHRDRVDLWLIRGQLTIAR